MRGCSTDSDQFCARLTCRCVCSFCFIVVFVCCHFGLDLTCINVVCRSLMAAERVLISRSAEESQYKKSLRQWHRLFHKMRARPSSVSRTATAACRRQSFPCRVRRKKWVVILRRGLRGLSLRVRDRYRSLVQDHHLCKGLRRDLKVFHQCLPSSRLSSRLRRVLFQCRRRVLLHLLGLQVARPSRCRRNRRSVCS